MKANRRRSFWVDIKIVQESERLLPVNTIGPIVQLTPGSISIAVDRMVAKGLVSRVESTNDRRIRIVSLTQLGRDLIVPAFPESIPGK